MGGGENIQDKATFTSDWELNCTSGKSSAQTESGLEGTGLLEGHLLGKDEAGEKLHITSGL